MADDKEKDRSIQWRGVLIGAVAAVLAAAIGAGSSIVTTHLSASNQSSIDRSDFLRQSRLTAYTRVLNQFRILSTSADTYTERVLANCGSVAPVNNVGHTYQDFLNQEQVFYTDEDYLDVLGPKRILRLASNMVEDEDLSLQRVTTASGVGGAKPLSKPECQKNIPAARLRDVNEALHYEGLFTGLASKVVGS